MVQHTSFFLCPINSESSETVLCLWRGFCRVFGCFWDVFFLPKKWLGGKKNCRKKGFTFNSVKIVSPESLNQNSIHSFSMTTSGSKELLEPDQAVFGRRSPWTSHQFIVRPHEKTNNHCTRTNGQLRVQFTSCVCVWTVKGSQRTWREPRQTGRSCKHSHQKGPRDGTHDLLLAHQRPLSAAAGPLLAAVDLLLSAWLMRRRWSEPLCLTLICSARPPTQLVPAS